MRQLVFHFFVIYCVAGSQFALPVVADDVSVVITEDTVEKIASVAFPINVQGSKKVGVGLLGKNVRYQATVRDPRIRVTEERQAFTATADVKIDGGVSLLDVPVRGTLDVKYDEESGRVIVDVGRVVMPISVAGLFKAEIDVTDDVPVFPIGITIPRVGFTVAGKDVSVEVIPTLSYATGVIKVDVELRAESE